MKCRFCGKENDNSYAFCVYCGKRLEAEEAIITLAKESELTQVQEQVKSETKISGEPETVAVTNEPGELAMSEQGVAVSEATTKEEERKGKKGKLKIAAILLGLVVGGAGIGVGAFYLTQNTGNQAKTYEESYDPNTVFGVNFIQWESGNYGDVYTQKIGEEKKKLGEGFDLDSFIVSPKTGDIVYLDEDDRLQYAKLGEKPKVISEDSSYYYFEETSRFIIFIENTSSGDQNTYIYDTEKDTKELLVEGWTEAVYYDASTDDFYYIDNDKKFYKLVNRTEKNRIATDVVGFNILDSDYYFLATNDFYNPTCYLYRETKDGIEKEKLNHNAVDIWNAVYIKESQAVLFNASEDLDDVKQIYIKLPGQEEVQLVDKVKECTYSEDANKVYYLNTEDELYSIDVPEINKKALADRTYFEKVIDDCEVNKLLGDVVNYSLSPNGKSVVARDIDDDLYLLREDEKEKIDSSVMFEEAFNEHVYYMTSEGELFIQEGIIIEKLEALPEAILITDQLGEDYSISEFGRYITYLTEETVDGKEKVSLMRYDTKKGEEVILEDINVYDAFVINDLEYERKMSYEELVGYYACEELETLIKIEEDGEFIAYTDGERLSSVYPKYNSYGRYSLDATLVDDSYLANFFGDEITFNKLEDDTFTITVGAGYVYPLENISEDDFNQKLEEQARVAEERQAAEAERIRREALESTAEGYYNYGAFIPANTYIYTTYDYSTQTTLYTNKDKTWPVTNYHIDYDTSVIWVEISYTYQGNDDYGWLPIQQ